MSEKIVIIGGSHGGVSVIEVLKREGFQGRLTLISDERIPICSPTVLPYLFGEKNKRIKFIRPGEFYNKIDVIEEKASHINPEKSFVQLRSKRKIAYDRLVIATGASAVTLPIEISNRIPIFTLRRIEDLERIEQRMKKSRNIIIIGAGLIGLHLAQVFSMEHRQVHMVELKDQILPGLVHAELATYLKGLFEQRGIEISLGTSISEIGEKEAMLSNGEKIKVDMTIVAIGIQPNLSVIEGTFIGVNKGVLVNERMETNIPGIYACGDVAEYRDFFTGEHRLNPNVINAAEQGKTVAEALLGKTNGHPGLISINIFDCLGMNLFSLGTATPGPDDRFYEEENTEMKVFKRMVFQGEILKGMVLFNTKVDGGVFYKLMRQKTSLKGLEDKLLKDPLLWGKWIAERVFK